MLLNFSRKNILIIALTLSVVVLATAAFFYLSPKKTLTVNNTDHNKVQITTSFYPLYEFSRQVGGDLAEVKNITPAGSEPHDYEPTSKQIQDIYNSNFLVYNGAGLEAWTEKVVPELSQKNIPTLNISNHFKVLPPLSVQGSSAYEEPSSKDPHFWVNPVMAKQETQDIADKLSQTDSSNSSKYQENAKNYIARLENLNQKFKSKLSNCSIHSVVTSHNFLQYLGKEYNFDSTPISGISPDSEPSVHDLAIITQLIKSKNIKYIFTETLISPKLSQTLANETGAKTLVLNPLEGLTGDQINQGQDYISVMEENLNNLSIAMDCK